MGIRTIGFEKASRSSPVDEEKSQKQKKEEAKPVPLVDRKSGGSHDESPVTKSPDVEVKTKPPNKVDRVVTATSQSRKAPGKKEKTLSRSPVKVRTPKSMARLGGMKTTARKLKKHRKRSLFVHSANKYIRSSIKTNKTRPTTRQQEEKEKPRESESPPQPRISTRMLIRRSSREGVPEDPLRTVELIKRPLELREPATKLLYMASLGLYPNTGDSDMTPIVVVKEVCVSPGKKNGVRKSLELPLFPYHKRFMDLSSQDKRGSAESSKSATSKPPNKRETRKASPIPNQNQAENLEAKKPNTVEKNQSQRKSSPNARSDVHANSTIISSSQAITAVSSITITEVPKKKASLSSAPTSFETKNNLNFSAASVTMHPASDLTITPSGALNKLSPVPLMATNTNQAVNPITNSKSILKTNLSPPLSKIATNSNIMQQPFPIALNLTTTNPPAKVEIIQPLSTNALLAQSCNVTNAMNLLMSNITILPSLQGGSRKRCASPPHLDQNTMSIRPVDTITCGNNITISLPSMDRKPPPKKRQKTSNEMSSRAPLPLMNSLPVVNSISQNTPYLPPVLSQQGEALNLCVKRRSDPPPIPALSQSPPKLQFKSDMRPPVNGSKPLNLIIPRPPPLTKAPLEITNIANCTQNFMQSLGVKGKPQQTKKPRKLRQQNHNHVNQPNHSQIHQSLPQLPMLSAETAVHAKSLLKCMNGEENACREVGESLDSVKTMLARLQTSIGPAVNGVRLITIE